jgi:prevent-host-death family protein
MVRTLRESKAKLSELVDAASRGEDVLITVRGKVKARLTRVIASETPVDGEEWARELRAFRRAITRPSKPGLSVEQILSEVREDRF